MKSTIRSSLVRSKNRNTFLVKEDKMEGRMYKSHQKDNNFEISTQLGLAQIDKSRKQYKYQSDLYKNPELSSKLLSDGQWKFQERANKNKTKLNFQKTISGFNKQRKQISSPGKFYETSINGFLITNNRPMSKKQNRQRIGTGKRQEENAPHYQDDFQPAQRKPLKCFKLPSDIQKPQFCRRPQTSKGQKKRGITNTNQDNDQQLMNQLIPEITEEQQFTSFPKKDQTNPANKKKRVHPMSAAQKKNRDVTDLIKLNSNTQRRSLNDFVVPFQTTMNSDFLCLFANGK